MDNVDMEMFVRKLHESMNNQKKNRSPGKRSPADVTELDLCGPFTLKGLRDYPNLESLSLECGELKNLDELKTLNNLRSLSLTCTKVKDFSAIGELTTLTELHLMDSGPLPDISKLSNLEFLSAAAYSLPDIGCLSGLTGLKEVKLQCCKLADITPLQNLVNLEKLDLFGNDISDISALSRLCKLTDLKLTNNTIEDLTPLSGLQFVKVFNISENPVDWNTCGLTDLRFFPDLEELDLSETGFWATGDFILCPGLKKLRLCNNGIEDIYFVSWLPELEVLNLYGNPVFDLSALAHLYKLCDLTIQSRRDSRD